MENNFQKGEVVWAKVRGYSWWPGIIKKITLKSDTLEIKENKNKKELKYFVKFIGDNSHSILTKDKLQNFQEKFSVYSKSKKRQLINSIKLAKKFLSGEVSLIDLNKNEIENIDNEENSNEKDEVRIILE